MSRVVKFEENWIITNNSKKNFNLNKLIEKLDFSSFQLTESKEENEISTGKNYGLSFYNEENGLNEEIAVVKFKTKEELDEFCKIYERITSTYNQDNFPEIINKDLPAPYSVYTFYVDDIDFMFREDIKNKFSDYEFGNVDVKPVIKSECINNFSKKEIKYYEYKDELDINLDKEEMETGYLVNISGNEIFFDKKKKVKEFLTDLCLGENELCTEKEEQKVLKL